MIIASDVNKDLGPKAKDLDPKAKDLDPKAKALGPKAKDSRCQRQITRQSSHIVYNVHILWVFLRPCTNSEMLKQF